jgi:hypothetical protein
MRPKEKLDAKRMSLTLSGPARDWLDRESKRSHKSRTKVVEDLIEQENIVRETAEAEKKTLALVRPVRYESKRKAK